MGSQPAEQPPDLFSTSSVRDTALPTEPNPREPAVDPQRHVLPKNLRHAVKHLSDGELDELFEVVFDETKRRGRLTWSIEPDPTEASRRSSTPLTKRSSAANKAIRHREIDVAEVSLTRGQVNAVRAAFKAGFTPSRIARQFGISQSNVRKALAANEPK